MKKFWKKEWPLTLRALLLSILLLLLGVSVLVPWQRVEAGVPLKQRIVQHGHNGPTNGGTLNAPSLKVTLSADQLVTCGATTILSFNATITDTNSWYNAGTFKYTPLQSGKYLALLNVTSFATTPTFTTISLRKNDSIIRSSTASAIIGGVTAYIMISDLIQMNGTTDYVNVSGIVNGASNCNFYGGASNVYTSLAIIRISN